jgi:hypothetical protein
MKTSCSTGGVARRAKGKMLRPDSTAAVIGAASRWHGSQVPGHRPTACRSQFQNASDRAYLGKERIKARLIGNLDPSEWDLPPKPKWMRWETYQKYEERFDRYEEILDYGCAALATKLTELKIF